MHVRHFFDWGPWSLVFAATSFAIIGSDNLGLENCRQILKRAIEPDLAV